MNNRLANMSTHAHDGRTSEAPRPLDGTAELGRTTRVANAAARKIGVHPIAALATAFVVGLLLGNWVKR